MLDNQRKSVIEYVSFDFPTDERNLFDKIEEAWLKIPNEYRGSAVLLDYSITYNRPETDEEMNARIEEEKLKAEAAAKIAAARNENRMVKELHQAVNSMLSEINENWNNLAIGSEAALNASLPMADGRMASVKVIVAAKEQIKSVD